MKQYPDMILKNCMEEEKSSGIVRHFCFAENKREGHIYLLTAYPGVNMWVCDFKLHKIQPKLLKNYNLLKINYCLDGRCEVRLPDTRYIYLTEGTVSVDLNQAQGIMKFPTGVYRGLEIVVDLSVIGQQYPVAWRECGIEIHKVEEYLYKNNGSYLAATSSNLNHLAQELEEHIRKGDLTEESLRFMLLQFLYLLKNGKDTIPLSHQLYMTHGQKEIAIKVEKKISNDCRNRYTITELAEEQGVSASSLKKYFTQVYGMPISRYLCKIRMEQAKRLLIHTNLNVADIAAEVGYENQGKFGTVFRNKTGITPIEYRRINRTHDKKGEKV